MSDWRSLIDEQLRDAIRAGEFDNLAGQGKPLKLDDDPNVPEHLRLAHKLLRDNDLQPDWMIEGKALEVARGQIMQRLHQAARAYKRVKGGAERSAAAWATAQRIFHEETRRYNKRVLTYNLKLPRGVNHRPHLDPEREILRALEN